MAPEADDYSSRLLFAFLEEEAHLIADGEVRVCDMDSGNLYVDVKGNDGKYGLAVKVERINYFTWLQKHALNDIEGNKK